MSWIPDFCKPWSLGELIAQAVDGVAKTPRERAILRLKQLSPSLRPVGAACGPVRDLDFRPGSGREGSRKSRLLKSEQRGRATVGKRGGIAGREEGRGERVNRKR